MNPQARITELAKACLAPNRSFAGVQFIDQLLPLASEVGEIGCNFVDEHKLRFQIGDEPPWEVEFDRARAKLRMLCARLAVLCQESGHDFMLYGGEGTIDRTAEARPDDHEGNPVSCLLTWQARWMNTPGEHWFVIAAH